MALVISSIDRRPLMLKDYLRDDLSSSSSNGFRSFPRRQCCTTVRFLLQIDLKAKDSSRNYDKRILKRSRSRVASTAISAIQKASEAVLKAVKQLPFPSINYQSQTVSVHNRARIVNFGRRLSRRLSKKRTFWFWRKLDRDDHGGEIRQGRSLREFLDEKHQLPDQNINHSTTTTSTTTICGRVWTNSSSNSRAERQLTADVLRSSSGNSEISRENESAEGKKILHGQEVSRGVDVAVGEDSISIAYSDEHTKGCPHEEKEQFSPVSVLDCPFEDEEEVNSPFQRSLARMEGTKQKLMQKIRRFESLAQPEPVDLEKLIALSEQDDESLDSPMQLQPRSMSIHNVFKDAGVEDKVQQLLELTKTTIPSNGFKFKTDKLLTDFFRDRIECEELEQESVHAARDWINGHPHDLFVGCEVIDGRKVYVRDMENNGRWRNLKEEKAELCLELEMKVFDYLMNEAFDDFMC